MLTTDVEAGQVRLHDVAHNSHSSESHRGDDEGVIASQAGVCDEWRVRSHHYGDDGCAV